MKKILLASQSLRRKELLQQIGYQFTSVKIDCEETYPESLPPEEIAAYLSALKSAAYPTLADDEVLLTADTIVEIGGRVLGKPKDRAHAAEMLAELSGKTHKVYTSITVRSSEQTITETDVAEVAFAEISPKETAYYLDHYHPYDKAGAYGIQEWLGMAKVTKISGSFYTIMGLPVHRVYEILKKIGC